MKNLAALRKKKGLTQARFSRMFGVSTSTVAMWETGHRKPDRHTIIRLCEFFAVSFEELMGTPVQYAEVAENIPVPVVGCVQGGLPSTALENIKGYRLVNRQLAEKGELFALEVKGHSMEPKMSPGDTIIVRRTSTAENGRTVVVLVGREEATVKKIMYHKDGITLVPTNPDYMPIYYTRQECRQLPVTVIGVVVELRCRYE